jgi:starch phosphorylase
MKALANGVLNLSTLDGWWADAWDRLGREALTPGWSIGSGEEYADPAEQDAVEAGALYEVLERSVVPEFFERGADGLPRRWVERMQLSLSELCPQFNTHRMVREYTESYYLPALRQHEQLLADGCGRAKALAQWRERVRSHWTETVIETLERVGPPPASTGERLEVIARVRLGPLAAEDVAVELYVGRVNASGELTEVSRTPMTPAGGAHDGRQAFTAAVSLHQSGRVGYTARLVPRHFDAVPAVLEGLVRWAQ